jgi:hypothetical protein
MTLSNRSIPFFIPLIIAACIVFAAASAFAYGGGGGGGGGGDGNGGDSQTGATTNRITDRLGFVTVNNFPLGVGCGWGVGVMEPGHVVGAGINPSVPSESGGTTNDKDAETALNELRSGYSTGTMTAQDVKQDLLWGQEMGVYTSEQAQAVLHDLNIEKKQDQPRTWQEPPVKTETPQDSAESRLKRDAERIDFMLSLMLDLDLSPITKEGTRKFFGPLSENKHTYYILLYLYLRGKNLKDPYFDYAEIRQRLEQLRKSQNK